MAIRHPKTALFLFLILYPLASFCQDGDPILKIGQKISIHSEALNETRDVWIYLPPNYSDKYFQAQQFPVLYVLDGDAHFHSLSGLIQILSSGVNWTFAIPEMIIVAIPNTNRVRDLLPTHSTTGADGKGNDFFQQSGGTDNFLKFITQELAPKIESTFRTFPYKILIGQSFGGLTVMHALCTIPKAFNAYVAIEPSLWWDDQSLLKQRREYFTSVDLKERSLYLAQANSLRSWDKSNAHFEGIKEFATLLETRNKSGLRWRYKFYPDDDHSSVAFVSEYDALRFIFEKYRVDYNIVSTAEQLKSQYQQLSRELGITFLPPERITQALGNTYLYLAKYDTAQRFFQMNIDNYPNSSSAYANMGQYWKSRGDKKKALAYYEKSVTIFPQNEDSYNNIENLKKEIKAIK
jgi:predicted alpha/beta superfamily hydrolase